jgi:hypothetical protein
MGEENQVGVVDQALTVAKSYIVNESNASYGRLLDIAEKRSLPSLSEAKEACQDVNLWLVFLDKRVDLDHLYQVKEVNEQLVVREGCGQCLQ